MNRNKYAFLFIMVILTENAFALRCNSKIISPGIGKVKVLQYCGKPSYKDKWLAEEKTESTYTLDVGSFIEKRLLSEKTKTIYREEWLFNFGTNKFIYILSFNNNKLTEIATGNYGYNERLRKNFPSRSKEKILSLNQTKLDVLMIMGEPDLSEEEKEKIEETETIIPVNGKSKRRPAGSNQKKEKIIIAIKSIKYLKIDKWFYNPEKGKISTWIIFTNGRISKIESGEKN